jgi:hypothetical protein
MRRYGISHTSSAADCPVNRTTAIAAVTDASKNTAIKLTGNSPIVIICGVMAIKQNATIHKTAMSITLVYLEFIKPP